MTVGARNQISAFAHTPVLEKRIAALRALLVAVYVFGIYTNLSLQLGELRVFGAYSIAAGLLLLFTRLPADWRFYRHIGFLAVLCALTITFGANMFDQGLRSGGQLILVVLSATGLARELLHWDRRVLARLALWSAGVVTTLAIFEVYGGMAPFFNALAAQLYGSEVFYYTSELRDTELHGGIRPKVLTQEPSHPAKFVAVMLSAWLLLATSRARFPLFLVIFGAAAVSMRSPTLIMSLIVGGYSLVGRTQKNMQGRRAYRMMAAAVVVLSVTTVQNWVGLLPFERAKAIADGSDASSVIRLVGPISIAWQEIEKRPLFGVGVGATDAARETLLNVYSKFSSIRMERFDLIADSGWGNAFFQFVAFFGLLGGALFCYWLVVYCRRSRIYIGDAATILLIFTVVFNFEGAFVISRPWSYFFILLVAFAASRSASLPQGRRSLILSGLDKSSARKV